MNNRYLLTTSDCECCFLIEVCIFSTDSPKGVSTLEKLGIITDFKISVVFGKDLHLLEVGL